MNVTEMRRNLKQVLDTVYRRRARVIVEKSGIPVAALISVADLARFRALEQQRAERFRILNEIGAAFKDVPLEELEREVNRALTEVRARRRAAQNQTTPA
jgi:prevent-host-death family protein